MKNGERQCVTRHCSSLDDEILANWVTSSGFSAFKGTQTQPSPALQCTHLDLFPSSSCDAADVG